MRVYGALGTSFTHSGVTERHSLVLKSTHLSLSFQSGSLQHKKRGHVLSVCGETLRRKVAHLLRQAQRFYAERSGFTRVLTGLVGCVVRCRVPQAGYRSSTARLLPACRRSSPAHLVFSAFGGASRGLPWKLSASYWLKSSLTRSD